MTLRLALVLLSLVLSLAISADRPSNTCPRAWSAGSDSQTVDEGLGVNIHFTDPLPGEVRMIADAGFRLVRMDFKWDLTERERGRYDFSAYDRLMSALEPFQIRALFILDYGNPLYDKGQPPRTEATRQAFARWAAAAAKHFAGRGVTWEVYNEPNNPIFWSPSPSVDEYVALALAVGRAFRAEAPNEKLVGPATSKIDLPFLEACFKAGLLDYWSAVSVHPYRHSDPEAAANEYCRLRDMIKANKSGSDSDRVVTIIAGEWGYSSVWRGMSEEKQGAMLVREILTNVGNGITTSVWYDWRDDGPDPTEAEHHFGLVRNSHQAGRAPVFEPKPAYLAAKTLIDHFKGYRFEQRLAIGSDDDYVLVFSQAADRRLAAWTTSPVAHRISIPLGTGRFTLTRHNGEGAGSITADQQAVSIEISSAPVYLSRVNR